MSEDPAAHSAKRREIEQLALDGLSLFPSHSPEICRSVVNALVRITPPTEPDEVRMELVTIFGSGTRGRSSKPGNIVLNWKRLVDVVPDVALVGASAAEAPPWLHFFIALYVWNKLRSAMTEELTDADASIMYALWKVRNEAHKVAEADAYRKTNDFRHESGLNELTERNYGYAIDRLVSLGCIEMSNGMIWLREWVRISYG